MAIFRRTLSIRRPRRWFVPTAPASGVTFTPSAASSSWVVPAAVLLVGALTLTPTAANAAWTVTPSTRVMSGLTLTPSAASSAWTVGAATLSAGGVTLTPTAASAAWTVGTGTFSSAVTFTPPAASSAWTVPAATLSKGPLTLSATAAHSAWTVAPSSLLSGSILVATAAHSAWHVGNGLLAVAEVSTSPIIGARGVVERRGEGIRTRNRPPIVRLEPAAQAQDSSATAPDGWAPTDNSGAGLTFTYDPADCFFVRVDTLVFAYFRFTVPANGDPGAAAFSGLPFSARATPHDLAPVTISFTNAGIEFSGIVFSGQTYFVLYSSAGAPITNAQLSSKTVAGCAIYEAAS